jgi:hypothetical protein
MNRNLTLILAFAAGLLGGVLSRWITPTPVLAQAQATPPASSTPVPKEIRAQRFTLVGEDGAVLGTFGNDSMMRERVNGRLRGNPTIKLFDESGKEIWSWLSPIASAPSASAPAAGHPRRQPPACSLPGGTVRLGPLKTLSPLIFIDSLSKVNYRHLGFWTCDVAFLGVGHMSRCLKGLAASSSP